MSTARLLASAVVAYAALVAWLSRALDGPALEQGLRLQARLSFVLFLAAIAGAGLARLMPLRASSWLARERSALVVAFAHSHLIHGGWVVLYLWLTPARFDWTIASGSGVLAFGLVWIWLVAQTRAGRRWLPAHARLDTWIAGYLWLQFVGFFWDRMLTPSRRMWLAWYVMAILLSLAAAALAWWGRPAARAR